MSDSVEGSSEKSVLKEETEDDSNVITLDEFIEEETRLETNANALLGPSDDKNCTYSQGYMGRQALYACKTCCSEDGAKVAGICLACTYHCHEGHDLIELYTKRNFRCDCGNSRFKNKKCNLEPNKDDENAKNSYNQNFDGCYCTCKRPYPDPDDSVADEMIQCIICEDWYHTRHLHTEMPSGENYAEMICTECTESLPFLNKYLGYSVTKMSKEESSCTVDVIKNGEASGSAAKGSSSVGVPHCSGDEARNTSTQDTLMNGCAIETKVKQAGSSDMNNAILDGESPSKSVTIQNSDTSKVPNNHKTGEDSANTESSESPNKKGDNMETEVAASSSAAEKDVSTSEIPQGCLLDKLQDVVREKKGATFWPYNFRTLLCSCTSCKEMYSKLGVNYLLDNNDTVQSYEEKGRIATNSDSSKQHSMDRVLGMLSKMGVDRFSQAEAILNYNELKSNLRSYLSKFVENKKVVREEDIHEFFTEMKARKRQKLDLPFTCR